MHKISTERLVALKEAILARGTVLPESGDIALSLIEEVFRYRAELEKNADYVSFGMGIVRDVLLNSLDEMARHEDFKEISYKKAYEIIRPAFLECLDKIVAQKAGHA